MRSNLFLVIILGWAVSCNQEISDVQPSRAIYHWKTTWDPSANSLQTLSNLEARVIYLRLFDVSWDETEKKAIPIAQTGFQNIPDDSLTLIPVVFITNEVFVKISKEDAAFLATRVMVQINTIMEQFQRDFTEVQIDCDWTESSRKNYFFFLEELKKLYEDRWMQLSATIRLHQIKYQAKTGVPPVDCGMLMFYNMGEIQAGKSLNSIYNDEDAAKYVSSIEHYSLPLDVALPLYSWTIQSRNGKVIALLNGDFRVDSTGLVHGQYIMKGDELKYEKADHALCLQAAELVKKYLKKEKRRVVIFDLDSTTINTTHEKDLEKIYATFN